MKTLLRLISVVLLFASATVVFHSAPASAVTIATNCGDISKTSYQFGNPNCWGGVGNPPDGCINAMTPTFVNNNVDCNEWQKEVIAAVKDPTVAGTGSSVGSVSGNASGVGTTQAYQSNTGPTAVSYTPTQANFDDSDLHKLTSGLSYFALVLCVGGIFVSAGLWATGSKGNNEGQAHTGKRGIIVCVAAAFILGALPSLFTFYDGVAKQADTNGVTRGN